jgi:predicted dehydrogenase
MPSRSSGSSRREFLRRTAAGAVGLWIAKDPRIARGWPANEALRVGIVGVSGQGGANLGEVAKSPNAKIVALCDVDSLLLEGAAKNEKCAGATLFRDFRKMIDAGGLDAVVVSTPDHVHAPATTRALAAKLHVYCEKPLTHSVSEARFVTEFAKRQGVATQMGTQIHARANYRRVVEVVRSGAIGDVQEVHVWVANDYGGGDRPTATEPTPPTLEWDLWLGPAPQRPFSKAYCPFWWRGWWDFGSGSLGDMACHHMDLSFWALELEGPLTVETEGPPVHAESTPKWLIVRYTMKRKSGGTIPLTWYDGGKRPHHFADGVLPQWGNGTLFVGSKGMLLADYDRYVLLPAEQFKDFTPPAPTIPESIGHHEEWIRAAKGGEKALCDFSYSGPLTEAVLLGMVAFRASAKLTWDRAAMKTGSAKADEFLLSRYREGFELSGAGARATAR